MTEKDRLILDHIRLAEHHARKWQRPGVDPEDLLQDAIVGLVEAANRYDGRARFSTYAHFWIRRTLQESVLNNWSTIRIPKDTYRKLAKYDEAKQQHPGHTFHQLADLMNITNQLERNSLYQALQARHFNRRWRQEPDHETD